MAGWDFRSGFRSMTGKGANISQALPFAAPDNSSAALRAGCIASGLEVALPDARPLEVFGAYMMATLAEGTRSTKDRVSVTGVIDGGEQLGDWVVTVQRRTGNGRPAFAVDQPEIRSEVEAEGREVLARTSILKDWPMPELHGFAVGKLARLARRRGGRRLAAEVDDGAGMWIRIVARKKWPGEALVEQLVDWLRWRRAERISPGEVLGRIREADRITNLEFCTTGGPRAIGSFEGATHMIASAVGDRR